MHRSLLALLLALLVMAYPLAVYFGLQYLPPRAIGLVLAVLLALRLWFSRDQLRGHVSLMMPALVLALLCALGAALFNSETTLRLTPVFVNAVSLVVFAITLWRPPSMIERFALIVEPDLDSRGVLYTRQVTKAWCLFFFCNASFALYTALYTSMAFWTLYNGLIAYLLMGLFFVVEYWIRLRVKAAVL